MIRLVLLLAVLAGGAVSAHADMVRMRPFERGNRSLGLQLGQTRLLNPHSDAVRAGGAVNAQYLYYAWDWIAVGIEAGYRRYLPRSKFSHATSGNIVTKQEAAILSGGVLARINLFENATWTPYLLGGVGAHQLEGLINDTLTGTGMTVTSAAGLEFFAVRDVSFSFEARYHHHQGLDEGKIGSATMQSLSYLFGFHFWWGRDW